MDPDWRYISYWKWKYSSQRVVTLPDGYLFFPHGRTDVRIWSCLSLAGFGCLDSLRLEASNVLIKKRAFLGSLSSRQMGIAVVLNLVDFSMNKSLRKGLTAYDVKNSESKGLKLQNVWWLSSELVSIHLMFFFNWLLVDVRRNNTLRFK